MIKKIGLFVCAAIIVLAGVSLPIHVADDGVEKITAEARHCRTYCRARRWAQRYWNNFVSEGQTAAGATSAQQNFFPEVHLVGLNNVQMHEGGLYDELGATANDAEDGDLTANIQIQYLIDDGAVDADRSTETRIEIPAIDSSTPPGRYVVKYMVTDSNNHAGYDERMVIIVASDACFMPYLTSAGDILVNDVDFVYEIEADMSTSTVQVFATEEPAGVDVNYGLRSTNFRGGTAPVYDINHEDASFPQINGRLSGNLGTVKFVLLNECGSVNGEVTIFKNIDNSQISENNTTRSGGGNNSSQAAVISAAAAQILSGSFSAAGSGAGSGGGSGGFTQPFGGTVVSSIYCSCNQAWAFFQAPVAGVPGPYLAYPASVKLNGLGVIAPGKHVVGTSVSGGVCSIYVIAWCFTFPTQQTVTLTPGVGTS